MYKALDMGSLGIDMPLTEGVALAARHGYAGITMSLERVRAEGADAIRAAMENYGVVNAGMNMPGYTGDDAKYAETLAQLPAWAKLARSVGCTRMNTGVSPASDRPFDEQHEHVVRRLRPFARILQDEGIMLGMEFLGPTEFYINRPHEFVRTLPAAMRLADSIGAWNCGVLVDAFHCHTAGHDMDIVNTITQNRISQVHINDAISGVPYDQLRDSPRMLPGETGVIDNKGLLKHLFHMGYEGPVVVEPFYEKFKTMSDADEKAAIAKAAMDGVWPV